YLKKIARQKKMKIDITTVHQNLDEVYWKMAQWPQKKLPSNSAKNFNLVKFNAYEFVINNAPAWHKYESMIYWYENIELDPEFDIHQYIIEHGHKIFNADAPDIFFNLNREINKIFRLGHFGISFDSLTHFNLFDHTNWPTLERKLLKLKSS